MLPFLSTPAGFNLLKINPELITWGFRFPIFWELSVMLKTKYCLKLYHAIRANLSPYQLCENMKNAKNEYLL